MTETKPVPPPQLVVDRKRGNRSNASGGPMGPLTHAYRCPIWKGASWQIAPAGHPLDSANFGESPRAQRVKVGLERLLVGVKDVSSPLAMSAC